LSGAINYVSNLDKCFRANFPEATKLVDRPLPKRSTV